MGEHPDFVASLEALTKIVFAASQIVSKWGRHYFVISPVSHQSASHRSTWAELPERGLSPRGPARPAPGTGCGVRRAALPPWQLPPFLASMAMASRRVPPGSTPRHPFCQCVPPRAAEGCRRNNRPIVRLLLFLFLFLFSLGGGGACHLESRPGPQPPTTPPARRGRRARQSGGDAEGG